MQFVVGTRKEVQVAEGKKDYFQLRRWEVEREGSIWMEHLRWDRVLAAETTTKCIMEAERGSVCKTFK